MSTIINPYHLKLHDLVLGTYASSVDRLADELPDNRVPIHEVAYQHGALNSASVYDYFAQTRVQTLRAWASPFDSDGAVTHANGEEGHRRENVAAILAVLGKRGSGITVQKLVPHPTAGGATQTLESVAVASGVAADAEGLRHVDFTLTHLYPFWHLLPKVGPVTVPSSIDLSEATAPIADMVFTFTGDGSVTYTNPSYGGTTTQKITISGSGGATVVVDVGARTVMSGSDLAFGWFTPNNARWMEWAPGGTINLSKTGTVTVSYYIAKGT